MRFPDKIRNSCFEIAFENVFLSSESVSGINAWLNFSPRCYSCLWQCIEFFRLKVEAILLTEGKTMLKDSDNAGLINIGPRVYLMGFIVIALVHLSVRL